ncbi:MAG: RNA polymerase sigma factor RpoD/SigA [bacterium]
MLAKNESKKKAARPRPKAKAKAKAKGRKAAPAKKPAVAKRTSRAAAKASAADSSSAARATAPSVKETKSLGDDTLAIYLSDVRKYSVLSREEEHELALKSRTGDEDAFNQLVRANLRYVISVANRYKGFSLSLEDLINEGNIGLIHAVRRFDPDRGVKLITYAVWWIRQSIMHAIADHTGTVRLPIKQASLIHKIRASYQKLRQRLDREPHSEELARNLDMKSEDIENVMRVYRGYLSLDAPISDGDDTSYLDMLEEENAVSAEENLFQHSLQEEIEDLLQGLDPREREIIRMRFGFDGEPMTLEEIGQKIGLSRERIRQIEKKAIRRFRARVRSKTLLDYLR